MATAAKNDKYLTEMDKLELKKMKDEIILKRMKEQEKKQQQSINKYTVNEKRVIVADYLGIAEKDLDTMIENWIKYDIREICIGKLAYKPMLDILKNAKEREKDIVKKDRI